MDYLPNCRAKIAESVVNATRTETIGFAMAVFVRG